MKKLLRTQMPLLTALLMTSLCILALFFLKQGRDHSIAAAMHQGEGLEDFIAHCTGCHGPEQVIAPQRRFRNWDEAILWMQKMQGMGAMDTETKKRVLKYLSDNYPLNHQKEHN